MFRQFLQISVARDGCRVRRWLVLASAVLLVLSGLAHGAGTGHHPGVADGPAQAMAHASDASSCCTDTGEPVRTHAECGGGGGCPLCVPAAAEVASLPGNPAVSSTIYLITHPASRLYALYRPPRFPVRS